MTNKLKALIYHTMNDELDAAKRIVSSIIIEKMEGHLKEDIGNVTHDENERVGHGYRDPVTFVITNKKTRRQMAKSLGELKNMLPKKRYVEIMNSIKLNGHYEDEIYYVAAREQW